MRIRRSTAFAGAVGLICISFFCLYLMLTDGLQADDNKRSKEAGQEITGVSILEFGLSGFSEDEESYFIQDSSGRPLSLSKKDTKVGYFPSSGQDPYVLIDREAEQVRYYLCLPDF